MKSVSMTSNPSYSMTDHDQDRIIHLQENSDVYYDMCDAITMHANPSYRRASEFDTTAHDITTVPMSDIVIQPNPSYSSDLDEDQYCYVETSEIIYHHTVHSAQCTSHLKLISKDDSVNEMTTD